MKQRRREMLTRKLTISVLALLLIPLVGGPASAASNFEGKTITIVVGYKPGGGYDRTARLLARYLPKHIPGNPTVVVQNLPGGAGNIAWNHIYNIAKPDGLTMTLSQRAAPLIQLGKAEGVKYDVTKMQWIGSAASEQFVLAIRSDVPYKTAGDLRQLEKPLIMGSTGPGGTNDLPMLYKAYLGLKLDIVTGYSSSSDIMLAIERKEVDGRAGSYSALVPFVSRGLIRVVIRARGPEKEIAHLPLDEDLAPNTRAKKILALRSAPDVMGRPFALPPGTPKEIVKVLREAFAKACNDPELLKEARKLKQPIDFIDGDEVVKLINEMVETPPDIFEEFKKYVKF